MQQVNYRLLARKEFLLSPVHHADSFQVDESFTDLQAEEQQGRICQRALVLYEIVPQLQQGHKFTDEAVFKNRRYSVALK